MRSRKRRAEPRSLSADLKRMSETLDYFVSAEPEAEEDSVGSEQSVDVAPDVEKILGIGAQPQQSSATPAQVGSDVAVPDVPPRAKEPPTVTPQAPPIPAALPASVPPDGFPWSPELVQALLPHLTPRQYLVYQAVFMASYARGLPSCQLRRRDIQRATGLSEATVRRALADLTGPLHLLHLTELPRYVYELRPLIPTQVLALWQASPTRQPPSS